MVHHGFNALNAMVLFRNKTCIIIFTINLKSVKACYAYTSERGYQVDEAPPLDTQHRVNWGVNDLIITPISPKSM